MFIIRVKHAIAYLRYSVLICFFFRSTNKNLIIQDICRWREELGLKPQSEISAFIELIRQNRQFRSLFYYRCPNIPHFLRKLYPPERHTTIAANCSVAGGGIFFIHAFSTHIYAKAIGYGCCFRQLTTIGVKARGKDAERPIIGNNVDFGANVNCIGDITIGDNAVIGAGAVVVKDVPSNAIVARNPARIIGYRN